ncbi:MAG: hypothetical protein ABW148_15490 [Sedimenticola sp.]
MFRLFIIICAFIGSAVLAAEKHETVPTPFHGNWASNLKYCGTAHINNLNISPNHIEFLESDGPILSIVTRGNNELALITELFGGCDEWLAFYYYRLSSDRNKLTDITDLYSKEQLVRYRCPSK